MELIEGEIIDMPPIGDRHAACVARLNRLTVTRAGDSAVVWVQNPIRPSRLLRAGAATWPSCSPGTTSTRPANPVPRTSCW